jgi:exopolyphosphatase/guanosine-5'-triphosphate,3'-diphosphate pyrophosphatase
MSAVAALDCGTNSTRLLIVDDRGTQLCREMRITRLGQGVDATGTLAPEALQRNYAVLEQYAQLMKEFGVTRSRLVATSAARDASNGAQFIERAAQITGAEVALLSGDEEARLSYRGALGDLEDISLPTMIVDIGGGSTELAAQIDQQFVAHSMQLGCVRVSERFLGSGVVTSDAAARTWSMIDDEITHALILAPRLNDLRGHVRLVGLAGTVSTLAQLDLGQSQYDHDAVHHRTVTLERVAWWRETLGAETPDQRLQRPGMVSGREDVLVGGLFILEAVMRRFDCSALISSESDIMDGLIASIVAE